MKGALMSSAWAVLFATTALATSAMAEDGKPVPAGTLEKLEHQHHGDGSYESPIAAELVLEWQNEYHSNSDDPAVDGHNNSFLRAELAPIVHINENFFIDGVLVFEPFDQAFSKNVDDESGLKATDCLPKRSN